MPQPQPNRKISPLCSCLHMPAQRSLPCQVSSRIENAFQATSSSLPGRQPTEADVMEFTGQVDWKNLLRSPERVARTYVARDGEDIGSSGRCQVERCIPGHPGVRPVRIARPAVRESGVLQSSPPSGEQTGILDHRRDLREALGIGRPRVFGEAPDQQHVQRPRRELVARCHPPLVPLDLSRQSARILGERYLAHQNALSDFARRGNRVESDEESHQAGTSHDAFWNHIVHSPLALRVVSDRLPGLLLYGTLRISRHASLWLESDRHRSSNCSFATSPDESFPSLMSDRTCIT